MKTIQGGFAQDHRGEIRFVNDFDMTLVKRFYIIKNADTDLVRGWRAHRIEQRWFFILSGSFAFDLVQIDDWDEPSRDLPIEKKVLTASSMQIHHIPAGYGTAFQAIEPNSELLVFADYGLEHAAKDDFTWPKAYFKNRIKEIPNS